MYIVLYTLYSFDLYRYKKDYGIMCMLGAQLPFCRGSFEFPLMKNYTIYIWF